MSGREPDRLLAHLSREFFQVMNSADPFSATMMGVPGFDSLVPDPSRRGSLGNAARFARIEHQLATIAVGELSQDDRINHAVLGWLAWGARSDLEHGLWEANASAGGYVNPQSVAFQAIPTAPLLDGEAVEGYRRRIGGLAEYFDSIAARYRQASSEGRQSTRSGVLQAVEQLDGHLAQPISEDVLVAVRLPAASESDRASIADLVESKVRPALCRLRACLVEELLPQARPDDRVGIRFVPGGEEGYRAALRRNTTTELTAGEIHQIGLDRIASLEGEWSELGSRVLGTSDVAEVRARLRDDPALRFSSGAEMVAVVTRALARA
ncbi:MAG TPA: DUF885 family protein, partial [Candidatus Dormibacteraeota bacterium]